MRRGLVSSAARRVSQTVGIIVLVVVALPFLPLFCICAVAKVLLWERWRDRRYCRKNDGRCFLVWTSRRGWHDFTVNNVLPALPESVSSVRTGMRAHPPPVRLMQLLWRHKVRLARPYLLRVRRTGIVGLPLNGPLGALKACGKKDEKVRSLVRHVILEAMRPEEAARQVRP